MGPSGAKWGYTGSNGLKQSNRVIEGKTGPYRAKRGQMKEGNLLFAQENNRHNKERKF